MNGMGDRIRIAREARGLSQEQLAARLGLSRVVVTNYENNKRGPSVRTLKKLSRELHVSTDYLLGLSDDEMVSLKGLNAVQKKQVLSLIDLFLGKA